MYVHCPLRYVKCEYCKQVVYAKDFEEFNKTCMLVPIKCHNGCTEKFLRGELTDHNTVCPLAEVECPYTKYGCKVRPFRRYLVSHLKLLKLKDQEEKLKDANCLEGVEWKLINYSQELRQTSPAFFVKNIKLQCHCIFENGLLSWWLKLYVTRIGDPHPGEISITQCYLILIDTTQNKRESVNLNMNCPLEMERENLLHSF